MGLKRRMRLAYIVMILCLILGLLLGFVVGYDAGEASIENDKVDINIVVIEPTIDASAPTETSKEVEMTTPSLDCFEYEETETLPSPEEIEKEEWEKRAEEYPTATKVWLYLTEVMGYNDHVAAGIIGNMMTECGGQTLNLNWKARNGAGHYGLCQWSPGYKAVQGADLEEQLEFMSWSFPKAIDQWGSICYKKGFDHDDFMAMEDARKAAYAFCVIYERPGPGSYEQRRDNAEKAYEYFTS